MPLDVDICVTCIADTPPALPLREELPSLGVEVVYKSAGNGLKVSQMAARDKVRQFRKVEATRDMMGSNIFPKSARHISHKLAQRKRQEQALKRPHALSYESYYDHASNAIKSNQTVAPPTTSGKSRAVITATTLEWNVDEEGGVEEREPSVLQRDEAQSAFSRPVKRSSPSRSSSPKNNNSNNNNGNTSPPPQQEEQEQPDETQTPPLPATTTKPSLQVLLDRDRAVNPEDVVVWEPKQEYPSQHYHPKDGTGQKRVQQEGEEYHDEFQDIMDLHATSTLTSFATWNNEFHHQFPSTAEYQDEDSQVNRLFSLQEQKAVTMEATTTSGVLSLPVPTKIPREIPLDQQQALRGPGTERLPKSSRPLPLPRPTQKPLPVRPTNGGVSITKSAGISGGLSSSSTNNRGPRERLSLQALLAKDRARSPAVSVAGAANESPPSTGGAAGLLQDAAERKQQQSILKRERNATTSDEKSKTPASTKDKAASTASAETTTTKTMSTAEAPQQQSAKDEFQPMQVSKALEALDQHKPPASDQGDSCEPSSSSSLPQQDLARPRKNKLSLKELLARDHAVQQEPRSGSVVSGSAERNASPKRVLPSAVKQQKSPKTQEPLSPVPKDLINRRTPPFLSNQQQSPTRSKSRTSPFLSTPSLSPQKEKKAEEVHDEVAVPATRSRPPSRTKSSLSALIAKDRGDAGQEHKKQAKSQIGVSTRRDRDHSLVVVVPPTTRQETTRTVSPTVSVERNKKGQEKNEKPASEQDTNTPLSPVVASASRKPSQSLLDLLAKDRAAQSTPVSNVQLNQQQQDQDAINASSSSDAVQEKAVPAIIASPITEPPPMRRGDAGSGDRFSKDAHEAERAVVKDVHEGERTGVKPLISPTSLSKKEEAGAKPLISPTSLSKKEEAEKDVVQPTSPLFMTLSPNTGNTPRERPSLQALLAKDSRASAAGTPLSLQQDEELQPASPPQSVMIPSLEHDNRGMVSGTSNTSQPLRPVQLQKKIDRLGSHTPTPTNSRMVVATPITAVESAEAHTIVPTTRASPFNEKTTEKNKQLVGHTPTPLSPVRQQSPVASAVQAFSGVAKNKKWLGKPATPLSPMRRESPVALAVQVFSAGNQKKPFSPLSPTRRESPVTPSVQSFSHNTKARTEKEEKADAKKQPSTSTTEGVPPAKQASRVADMIALYSTKEKP